MPQYIQLEFDFTIPFRPGNLVKVMGKDLYNYLELTGRIGVVESFDAKRGEYRIYFPDLTPPWGEGFLILPFAQEQLIKIPGRAKCSWQRKRKLKQLRKSLESQGMMS